MVALDVGVRERNADRTGARPRQPGSLTIDPSRVVRVLWVASAVVILLGILREVAIHHLGTGTAIQDLRHIAMDAEHSLPAWYESTLMAVAAVLLCVTAASTHPAPRDRRLWLLLALVFLAFSIDESVSFHEVAIDPLRDGLGLGGVLFFSWVLVAAPLLVVFASVYLGFLLRLPRPTAIGFAVAGTIFVGGAFGMELVGGYFASGPGMETVVYKTAAIVEETMEIIGMTLFVTAILRHLASAAPVLQIALRP